MDAIANSGCWMGSYDPEEATSMLRDEAAVRNASLAEVRRMLPAVVRGERFLRWLVGDRGRGQRGSLARTPC